MYMYVEITLKATYIYMCMLATMSVEITHQATYTIAHVYVCMCACMHACVCAHAQNTTSLFRLGFSHSIQHKAIFACMFMLMSRVTSMFMLM